MIIRFFQLKYLKNLGDLGLMGVLVPTEYGGSGFSYTEYVTAIQELSILDPSVGLSMGSQFIMYWTYFTIWK